MEYTKDIILNLHYKKGLNLSKYKIWISTLKKILERNRIIIGILALLITLITIDLILINSFLEILNKIY